MMSKIDRLLSCAQNFILFFLVGLHIVNIQGVMKYP